MAEVQLQSTLTCPACGHQATETMPTTACQFFYECIAVTGHNRDSAGTL